MSDATTKVFDRIRKLLAKAEGTDNDDEAQVFWDKATAMMADHAVSEAQIRQSMNTGPAEIISKMIPAKDLWGNKPYSNMRSILIYQIAKTLGVSSYAERAYSGRKTARIGLVGTEEGIERVLQVFRIADAQADRALLKAEPEYWESIVVVRRNIMAGFVETFVTKLKDSIVVHEETSGATGFGLILLDDRKRAARWTAENVPGLTTTRSSMRHSAGGREAGRQAGRNASIGSRSLSGQKALSA